MDKNNGTIWEGWICPRCGRVNAPWVASCSCGNLDPPRTNVPTKNSFGYTYKCCQNCSNNPAVNPFASGICNCALPQLEEAGYTVSLFDQDTTSTINSFLNTKITL